MIQRQRRGEATKRTGEYHSKFVPNIMMDFNFETLWGKVLYMYLLILVQPTNV